MDDKITETRMLRLHPNWVKDGSDYILHLGIMKKAVVVRYFLPNGFTQDSRTSPYYGIGQASYFPFTDEQYNTRFDNHYDACMVAENHIRKWLNSIIINNKSDNENNQLNESNKQIEG